MIPLEEWLAVRGEQYAADLETHREVVCRAVSKRLSHAFPSLCYDPQRPDAVDFQKLAYENTPRRFHRLIQVALRLQSIVVIEREYRWGWPILQRYNIEQIHLLSHIRWYFEAARQFVPLEYADYQPFNQLEATAIRIVRAISQTTINATNGNDQYQLEFSS